MPQPLYPQAKRPQYSMDTKLGGPQSQSGYDNNEKNPHLYQELNPSFSPQHTRENLSPQDD
jgi:hypothetical protein